jgi:ABC-type lipoprotein export system ATPase subunit
VVFEAVSVRREGRPILTDLSLRFDEGCWGAVVGPSGSGKTTIFNLISGLLRPSAGRVLVVGQDLARLGDHRLARLRNAQVATIFQLYNLVPDYSLLDNVLLPARVVGAKADLPRARSCLERVGLAERSADVPSRLSGGERQRLAIARTLYMRPRLILADEPTGNLDAQAAGHILQALQEMHEAGAGVLIATHDPLVTAQVPVVLTLTR